MNGLLDKKSIASIIVGSLQKNKPVVKAEKIVKDDVKGSVDKKEMDVDIQDQLESCANRLLRAIEGKDVGEIVRSFVLMHEAAAIAVKNNCDMEDDEEDTDEQMLNEEASKEFSIRE